MTLLELSQRAVRIRHLYAEQETASGKPPWTREQCLQGFVVDIGELMELVMAKAGARSVNDLDAKLAHELSDCLWSVLVLADAHAVDLEAAFLATMADVEAHPESPVGAKSAAQQSPASFAHLQERALSVRRHYPAYETAPVGCEGATEQLMEGFVVDVGELMRLSMAKAGVRTVANREAAFCHALSDCLWCVLVLSQRYAVSLEENFLQTMHSLETKIARNAKR